MRSPLRKINIVFILLALVPVSFAIYELGLLNKNEQIVRETYQNQLDAILYSVNQYSDDLISNWANRARLKIKQGSDSAATFRESWKELLNQSGVVRGIYFSDINSRSILYDTDASNALTLDVRATLDGVIQKHRERIERLIEYEQAGFRKMEAIDTVVANNCVPVLFAMDENEAKFAIGAVLLNLNEFIVNSLAPKLQTISQGEFIISAFNTKNDSLIYSTDFNQPSADVQATRIFKGQGQKKEFWILPGYYLGIRLKTATIDDLVKERSTTSLVVLSLLIVMLVTGLLFLYRNVRHEILLSQAKSDFVSNVSHEIRTPLSLIGMFAETLETGRVPSEEKKQEYYKIISKETNRLSKIVNRILDFSQLEGNKKVFRFTPIKLNELCEEILETYFYPLKEKGFEFQFIKEHQLPIIMGDREAVSEALINLLDNAVKYSGSNKLIALKTLSDHEYTHVEVVDKGIGIARHHHHDIFEQFFRAPTGDVHNTKGSGLGLTLVKKIMEAHHGKISVESAPGKGSAFRLSFTLKKIQHES